MSKVPTSQIVQNTRWSIRKDQDGTFSLAHPHFKDISFIPNFDVADDLLRAIHGGGFEQFVRSYERFYEALRRRIIGPS